MEIDPVGHKTQSSQHDERKRKKKDGGGKQGHKDKEATETYCYMQIIGEEKSWRFCCKGGEEELERWLGSLKSRVVATRRRRKEVVVGREKDRDGDGRGNEGLELG